MRPSPLLFKCSRLRNDVFSGPVLQEACPLIVLPFLFAEEGSQSEELKERQIYEADFHGNVVLL